MIEFTKAIKEHGNSDMDIIKGILAHKDYEFAQLKAENDRLRGLNEELQMALLTVRNLVKEIHEPTN